MVRIQWPIDFLRLGQRQAQAISKVSVAVAMTFKDGRPDFVRVALGAVAPTVIRARATEKALAAGGYEALLKAKEAVREEVRPIRRPPVHPRVPAGDGGGAPGARRAPHRRRLTRPVSPRR